jgi:hypothetical protein
LDFRNSASLTPTATYNQNVAYSTLNGLAEFSTRSWVGSQGPIGFGAEACRCGDIHKPTRGVCDRNALHRGLFSATALSEVR